MLGFLKVFSIFLEQVIFVVLQVHQACLKQLCSKDRPKYVVNGIVLDFMANIPGLIITLKPTWIDVRRKRHKGSMNAVNLNSPIPSIPHSLHVVPTFLSFSLCRTHCIPAHLRQRCISRQSLHSCQNSLVAVNFQLGRKLIGACLHLFHIPCVRMSDFPWEQALCPASHIRLLRYNLYTIHIVLPYTNCSSTMQNHSVKFWASSDVLSQSGVCFKKKTTTTLWKQEMRQRKKGAYYKCISLQLLCQMPLKKTLQQTQVP